MDLEYERNISKLQVKLGRTSGTRLFLKSRKLLLSGALMAVVGLSGQVWASIVVALPSLRGNDQRLVPVLLIIPVILAVIACGTFCSPLQTFEAAVPRNLRTIRTLHALALMLVGALSLVPGGFGSLGVGGYVLALRNYVGYMGLGCLLIPVIGARNAWILPLTYCFGTAMIAALSTDPQLPGWAWPVEWRSTTGSWIWAASLGTAGLVTASWLGSASRGADGK